MKRFLAILALLVVIAGPAFALDLSQARSSGAVGEKLDGYVAVIKASPDANALVKDINAKRLQEYTRISRQNNQPADVVAKLAAEQIINSLPKGSLYQAPDGSWKKR